MQIRELGYPGVALLPLQITRCLEAYILWLLGKTMFTEAHGDTISARYIGLAHQISIATCREDIPQRSWGSAVLAATYRGLCNVCRRNTTNSVLVGCTLLLQLWSRERLILTRQGGDKGDVILDTLNEYVVSWATATTST